MQQQQRQEWGKKETFNLLHVAASACAAIVTPLTRRNPGSQMPGPGGFLAFLALGYAFLSTWDPVMFWYGYFWSLGLVVQRVGVFVRSCKGVVTHSRYPGSPYLFTWLTKREDAARLLEIVCCLVAAAAAVQFSHTLSGFLFAGAFGLGFLESVERHRSRMQVTRAQDARIEMFDLQERLKGRY